MAPPRNLAADLMNILMHSPKAEEACRAYFSWRPDWADRFFVEPLESRYQRASISSPDSSFHLAAAAQERFGEGQIARSHTLDGGDRSKLPAALPR